MANVSRPLIALLAGTVLLAVLWVVALGPSSSGSGSSNGLGRYQPAINAAHAAAGASAAGGDSSLADHPGATSAPASTPGASAAASSAPATSTPATSTPATSTPAASTPSASSHATAASHAASAPPSAPPSAKPAAHAKPQQLHGAVSSEGKVLAALQGGKVLALLFYNPSGADDRAVHSELSAVPTHGGKVVELAVPITQLASYPAISEQVAITETPTLVIVDAKHQAWTLTGFVDGLQISTDIADALAVR